jgi:hypothetical protein
MTLRHSIILALLAGPAGSENWECFASVRQGNSLRAAKATQVLGWIHWDMVCLAIQLPVASEQWARSMEHKYWVECIRLQSLALCGLIDSRVHQAEFEVHIPPRFPLESNYYRIGNWDHHI